ncbi:MAG: site-specific integrase [Bacilli bacterium]
MKTKPISLNIFLKDCQYETIGIDHIKIISEQRPEHEDYSNFPQIINLDNIETSIEFNLFLIEKFRFNDFSPKNNNGKEITKSRIKNLVTSLTVFLDWLTENNINWKDESYIDDENPVNLFKRYLIDRITEENSTIKYSTSSRYLGDVKMLYEWAAHNHIINHLPFTYSSHLYANEKTKKITSKRAPIFQVVTTSINIPKKYKGLKIKSLSSYTTKEYELLINSKYCQNRGRQIWIKLAKEYGLRRTEIININEDILNEEKHGLYTVTGKNSKQREIYFKKPILNEIKEYCNSDSRKLALHKYFQKNKYTPSPPLFLNNQGNRISHSTITNIIYPVKAELKENGFKFNKTFHDLRATYAVERVIDLLKQGIDMEHIDFIITDELGHNLFETTKKYLVTRSVRESWISQSGIGDVLKENGIFSESSSKDIFDDFL